MSLIENPNVGVLHEDIGFAQRIGQSFDMKGLTVHRVESDLPRYGVVLIQESLLYRVTPQVPYIVVGLEDTDRPSEKAIALIDRDALGYVSIGERPQYIAAFTRNVLVRLQNKDKEEDILRVGSLEIDQVKMEVKLKGKRVDLERTMVFKTLCFLAKHPGTVLTRNQILDGVYGSDNLNIGTRIVGLHVNLLRAAICPEVIRTFRGVGYCLSAEET